METLTYAHWQTFVLVLLALCAAIVLVLNAAEKIQALFHPRAKREMSVQERLDDHDKKLDKDHVRLTRLESDTTMMLRTMSNLLEHQITGNGIEKMRETFKDLQEYLVKR